MAFFSFAAAEKGVRSSENFSRFYPCSFLCLRRFPAYGQEPARHGSIAKRFAWARPGGSARSRLILCLACRLWRYGPGHIPGHFSPPGACRGKGRSKEKCKSRRRSGALQRVAPLMSMAAVRWRPLVAKYASNVICISWHCLSRRAFDTARLQVVFSRPRSAASPALAARSRCARKS